jgi:hypothetical protein
MDTIYIETTIVGHIAGRIHRDPIAASRQQVTRDWWQNNAKNFEVFVSQLVIDECSDGDPSAAAERLDVIKNLDLIDSSDEVDSLARALKQERPYQSRNPATLFISQSLLSMV